MSKSLKVALIVAAVFYFKYLVIAKTPASWVANAIHEAVPNLWLTGAKGTAWNGVAHGAQIDIENKSIPMGSFRWELQVSSLLSLSPCFEIKTELAGRPLEGTVCQSITGAQVVKDFSADLSLDLIGDAIPVPVVGMASLQVIEASLSGTDINKLDARFSLQNTSVNPGNGWMEFGTFAATLSEDGNGGLSAQIMDIDASLGVDLLASWKVGAEDVMAKGTLTTREATPRDAISAIQIFAEEKQPNVYDFQWP